MRAEDRDKEAGIVGEWAEIPGRELDVHDQSGLVGVGDEVAELVAPIGTEADDDPTVGSQVLTEAGEHGLTRAWREKCHHVAGAHDHVERGTNHGLEVELSEVADKPPGTRMIQLGGGDQLRVGVDSDDIVPQARKDRSHAPWTAPGVEDAATARHHCVDESRLPGKIVTGCRHRPESLDVSSRMRRIGLGDLGPVTLLDHLVSRRECMCLTLSPGWHIDVELSGRLADMGSTAAVRSTLDALDAARDLGAVVDRDDSAVLARAAATNPDPDRVMAGRPLTIKDWIDVEGFICEGVSPERTGRRPTRDATVVARLRAAGAVVVAKTQPGADHAIHGRCHHPHDASRTPGGSSSGEAALIGRGASTLGLGSDSGGSIRLPAAWCGVVGFKPSYGLVPTTGHVPRVDGHADGRTVIGPMAANVADVVSALRVIVGPDGVDHACVPVRLGDPTAVSIRGLRLAVIPDDPRWPAAPSTRDAVDRAMAILERRGAVRVDLKLPLDLSESLDITQRYWTRVNLTGAEADRQLRDWDRFSNRLLRASADFDLILAPVVADVAPIARPLRGEDYVFTLPWSLTGWPAVSLPMGVDPSTGLPVAVQIAAPRWHDHDVLAASAAVEAGLGASNTTVS
jgi:amidase